MVARLTDLMIRGLAIGYTVLAALIVLTMIGLAVGVADRRAPFSVLPHERIPVYAGTLAQLEVPVWRDLTRPCDVTFSRYLFDSNEYRLDLGTGFFPFDGIKRLDASSPGLLRVRVPIPPLAASGVYGGVAPGHGRVATELEYVCNKGHLLFAPIRVHTDILIDIRP